MPVSGKASNRFEMKRWYFENATRDRILVHFATINPAMPRIFFLNFFMKFRILALLGHKKNMPIFFSDFSPLGMFFGGGRIRPLGHHRVHLQKLDKNSIITGFRT